ncbi:hypothetical protein PoB_001023100 [Plakobranchus ocellatus]|uniref:Uncharacterized protein n=1 Tax=Plakobranchus ocellatus TaxID=259542 RepID=A0AAV3YMT6_9GAST|nr:hypothetical protein PoB_001023100 [Plakobranchus ocellatus]
MQEVAGFSPSQGRRLQLFPVSIQQLLDLGSDEELFCVFIVRDSKPRVSHETGRITPSIPSGHPELASQWREHSTGYSVPCTCTPTECVNPARRQPDSTSLPVCQTPRLPDSHYRQPASLNVPCPNTAESMADQVTHDHGALGRAERPLTGTSTVRLHTRTCLLVPLGLLVPGILYTSIHIGTRGRVPRATCQTPLTVIHLLKKKKKKKALKVGETEKEK